MKKYIAELVGTFVLVLVACGVAAVTGGSLVETSLAFGLVIVAMAYSIGNVSGCHINPAVSLSMYLTKKISLKEFGFYCAAQVIGALLGSLVLWLFLGSRESLGANGFTGSVWIALLVEVVLTFIFVTVILAVTNKKENSQVAGIVIGLTLTLVHLIGIPFTGTSVNPARSLGPALIQGGQALKQVWVFILAPLAGAALAYLFYKYILEEK